MGQLRGGVGDGQRKYWQEKRSPPEPETGSSSARLRWFVDSQLLKRASHLAPAQSAREQSGRALRLLFLFIISSLSHANANNLCRGCLQKKKRLKPSEQVQPAEVFGRAQHRLSVHLLVQRVVVCQGEGRLLQATATSQLQFRSSFILREFSTAVNDFI